MPRVSPAWVWLLVAGALQLVSNGRWILAAATWLAPIGWLVFLQRVRVRMGITVAFVSFLTVELVAWRGLVPAPGVLYFLIVGVYSVVYFLPFLLHRLLAPRLSGFAGTLVFPSAWVGIEFAFQRWVTPYGSWFSIAYTQTDFLPLMQLAALAGTAGISFLVTWFAVVAVRLLDGERDSARRFRAALAYGLLFVVCIAWGEIRLARDPASAKPVRVAGILPSPGLARELETEFAPVRDHRPLTQEDVARIARTAARLNEDLLARTLREARAGAELVGWSETAGRVLEWDEARLLEQACRLAQNEKVDLLLGYGVWIPDGTPPFENKVVAVSRAGEIVWEVHKAHPIVGPESPLIRAGDGIMRAMKTPFGKVSAVICHDLDFPRLLRQAGGLKAGLVLGPSADWSAITPLHANMAVLRSIESGFSLFRPTGAGRSIAVDTRGRTLMAVDFADDAVVAHIPTVSVGTVYAALGDWFAWTCLGGLLLAIISASRRRQSARPT